jgi:hypothetical protein
MLKGPFVQRTLQYTERNFIEKDPNLDQLNVLKVLKLRDLSKEKDRMSIRPALKYDVGLAILG